MHRHRHPQKRIASLKLFADKPQRNIVETRATILLRNTNAKQSQLSHFVKNRPLEMRLFIPFLDIRRNLACAKFADGILQRNMFFS